MAFPFEEYSSEAIRRDHSPEFIESTINYASQLDSKELPVIFSRQHFASLVGMRSAIINEIIQFRTNQYIQFRIQKRNGKGFRLIRTPEKKLLYLQRWINKNILQNVPVLDCCTAFVPGTSLATNGYIHRSSSMILKIDLLKFFDTISERRVFGFFKYLGYHPNVAYDLAQLTTTFPTYEFWDSLSIEEIKKIGAKISFMEATLPQGAPTSPQLANCLATSLDKRLFKLSVKLNCRYSRYADDLIFSIGINGGKLPAFQLVKRIVENEGFFVNEDKTAYLKKGMKQIVTGLTVTHGFHVPKKFRQEVYKHLYYSRKYGPFEHLKRWMKDNQKNQEIIYGFKDWLLGTISYVYSIDNKNGKKMFEQFNKIRWGFDEQIVSEDDSFSSDLLETNIK
jgi:RNA-directed DNA polymerase